MHACYHACMTQITVRTDAGLIARVQSMARTRGQSMNEFVVVVLEAATNPAYAGAEADQIRERLRTAGLLSVIAGTPSTRRRPNPEHVRGARVRAGSGTSVSAMVTGDR
jgi:hypothetical protein